MKFLAFLAITAQLVGCLFSVWLVLSLASSALKTVKDDCGKKRYGIERYYIDGDFFCERK